MNALLIAFAAAFVAPIALLPVAAGLANVKGTLALVVVGALVVCRWQKRPLADVLAAPVARRSLLILTGAALALFLAKGITDYYAFRLSGIDFSIFDLMLYHTAQGRFMWTPMCDCNHFGIHPSYVLLPLVPLHALLSGPGLLIAVHAVAAIAGVWPLWRLARQYLPDAGLAALAVVAFLGNPWLGSLVGYGFHMEVFFLPAGLWFLWGWNQRRPLIWVPALLAFLAVKEDAALYMGSFAAFGWWRRPDRRAAAVAVLGLALAVLALNLLVVQPAMRPPGQQPGYLSFWQPYGGSLGEIATTMLSSPGRVLKDVLTSQWYLLFGSALFLPLLVPEALAAMLPAVLILGTSATSPMRHYGLYYAAPLLPFFFFALVAAYRPLQQRLGANRATYLVAAAAVLLLFTRNGSVRLAPPKLDVQADLTAFIAATTPPGPVCAQLSLVPHLPYEWDVRPLTPACVGLAAATVMGHLGLPTYPYDGAALKSLLAGSRTLPSGLLVHP